jgi:hypothetical protein
MGFFWGDYIIVLFCMNYVPGSVSHKKGRKEEGCNICIMLPENVDSELARSEFFYPRYLNTISQVF